MVRSLLTLGLLVSAVQAQAYVLDSVSCQSIRFFSRPNPHWKFLASREPGFVLAFQKTGERVGRERVKVFPDTQVVYPSHCELYLPREGGKFVSGPLKLLADFEWRDDHNKLHLEGYRLDLTMQLRVPNEPKSIELKTVEGFSFCRTQSTCLRMWVVDSD